MPSLVYTQSWTTDLGGTDWTGNATRSTTTTQDGGGALRINSSAAVGYWEDSAPADSSIWIERYYLRFAVLPDADCRISHAEVPGVATAEVRFQVSSGKLGCAVDAAFVGGVGGPVLTTGQWYRIDSRFDASTSFIKSDAMVDGVQLPQASTSFTTGLFSVVKLGSNANTVTMDAFWDNYKLSHTLGDYPIGADDAPPQRLGMSLLGVG